MNVLGNSLLEEEVVYEVDNGVSTTHENEIDAVAEKTHPQLQTSSDEEMDDLWDRYGSSSERLYGRGNREPQRIEESIDRVMLLYPNFADEICKYREAGKSDDDILSVFGEWELKALATYSPKEVMEHAGRTPESLLKLREHSQKTKLKGYEKLYNGQYDREAIEERLYVAEALGVSEVLLLENPDLYERLSSQMKIREGWADSIHNGYKRFGVMDMLSKVGIERMFNGDTPELMARYGALNDELAALQPPLVQDFGQETAGGVIEYLTQQLTVMGRSSGRGAKYGLAIALAALVAGQSGPQVLVPEEILTLPISFLSGSGLGTRGESLKEMYTLEAGLAFNELVELRDADGNPLDRSTAVAAASLIGVVNGAVEMIPFSKLIKSFPGAKKLLGEVTGEAVKKSLAIPSVRAVLAEIAKEYAGNVTTETITEIAQESIAAIIGELAKLLSGQEFDNMTWVVNTFSDRKLSHTLQLFCVPIIEPL